MKPVRISNDFSCHAFADEYLKETKKAGNCRDLEVRIRVPKQSKSGGIVRNKKTQKVSLTWVKYDSSRDYAELGLFLQLQSELPEL